MKDNCNTVPESEDIKGLIAKVDWLLLIDIVDIDCDDDGDVAQKARRASSSTQ